MRDVDGVADEAKEKAGENEGGSQLAPIGEVCKGVYKDGWNQDVRSKGNIWEVEATNLLGHKAAL